MRVANIFRSPRKKPVRRKTNNFLGSASPTSSIWSIAIKWVLEGRNKKEKRGKGEEEAAMIYNYGKHCCL